LGGGQTLGEGETLGGGTNVWGMASVGCKNLRLAETSGYFITFTEKESEEHKSDHRPSIYHQRISAFYQST